MSLKRELKSLYMYNQIQMSKTTLFQQRHFTRLGTEPAATRVNSTSSGTSTSSRRKLQVDDIKSSVIERE